MKRFYFGLLLPGLVMLLSLSSCNKLRVAPSPLLLLHERFPMTSYLDSLETLTLAKDSTTIVLDITGVGFPSPGPDTINGQAELAFAFRTSAPGFVNALGVYVPEVGYTYTVTLWDSATGTVLAQADIYSASAGWSYIALQAASYVQLQPDHGYIMGYNSAPVGEPLNSNELGGGVYRIFGLYDFKVPVPESALVPLFPMIYKSFTIEGSYEVDYREPISAPLFPTGNANGNTNGFAGACDIGFFQQ